MPSWSARSACRGPRRRIRLAAQAAGLAPTSMLGTETVARLLGLRLNHPQGQDELELLPNQPATRAEAAYSFARALKLSPGQVAWLDQLSQTFSVPETGEWQRTVLTRALRFVGYPYVWAGTSESTQSLWSATAPGGTVTLPGGFDCSGFVWRVYKTKPFPGAPLLGDMLKGRTTYAMSGEVKKPARIAIDELAARRRPVLRQQRPAVDAGARSGTPASTSGTAGSCIPRVPGSRCSRSRAGTRRRLRGDGGRSPKRASTPSGRSGKSCHASRGCKHIAGLRPRSPRYRPGPRLPASSPCSVFAGQPRQDFPERPLGSREQRRRWPLLRRDPSGERAEQLRQHGLHVSPRRPEAVDAEPLCDAAVEDGRATRARYRAR